jgi:putative oxidoreductase
MTEAAAAWPPRALSVLRIVTGLLIIQHGMAKVIGFPAIEAFTRPPLLSPPGAAGFIELICGALLILGLRTRPAALILAADLAIAYITGYLPKGFHPLVSGGTLTILYLFSCLYLSSAGAGPWSIDASRPRGAAMDKFDRTLAGFEPALLSIYRIVTGSLLFQYGLAKIYKIPLLPAFLKISPLVTVAGAIELIGGALLALGLLTRPVAFVLSGQMACAYFIGHMFKDGIAAPAFIPLLNGGNAAILFCFACLYFSCAGGGPWALGATPGGR